VRASLHPSATVGRNVEFICAWAERPSLGKYFELEVLKDFYLEDSWVLYISASPGQLVITVEFVLTEEHPYYSPPRAGEQYCYRKGVLVFDAVTDLNWTGLLSSRPSRDPDGSVDYGNIGSLIIEGNHYTVEGGLGEIDLHAASVRVALVSDGTTLHRKSTRN
jgi:hypothetical protein